MISGESEMPVSFCCFLYSQRRHFYSQALKIHLSGSTGQALFALGVLVFQNLGVALVGRFALVTLPLLHLH